jgi:hypothetical protein
MNRKSGEETRFLSHFSKTDFRYWSESVFGSGYAARKRKNGQPNALQNCSAPGLIFAISLNFSY